MDDDSYLRDLAKQDKISKFVSPIEYRLQILDFKCAANFTDQLVRLAPELLEYKKILKSLKENWLKPAKDWKFKFHIEYFKENLLYMCYYASFFGRSSLAYYNSDGNIENVYEELQTKFSLDILKILANNTPIKYFAAGNKPPIMCDIVLDDKKTYIEPNEYTTEKLREYLANAQMIFQKADDNFQKRRHNDYLKYEQEQKQKVQDDKDFVTNIVKMTTMYGADKNQAKEIIEKLHETHNIPKHGIVRELIVLKEKNDKTEKNVFTLK